MIYLTIKDEGWASKKEIFQVTFPFQKKNRWISIFELEHISITTDKPSTKAQWLNNHVAVLPGGPLLVINGVIGCKNPSYQLIFGQK